MAAGVRDPPCGALKLLCKRGNTLSMYLLHTDSTNLALWPLLALNIVILWYYKLAKKTPIN